MKQRCGPHESKSEKVCAMGARGSESVEVGASVGGLWRTSVSLTEKTTWSELKQLICNKTGVWEEHQRLTPDGEDEHAACGLGDGDEVMCEWELDDGRHPLHSAGE